MQHEIDKQVAEKVMGWKFAPTTETWTDKSREAYWLLIDGKNELICYANNWHPSTNIAQAWQVVEKLASKNIFISLMDQLGYNAKTENWKMWRVEFMDSTAHDLGKISHAIWFGMIEEKTASLAICKAALKVVEATQ